MFRRSSKFIVSVSPRIVGGFVRRMLSAHPAAASSDPSRRCCVPPFHSVFLNKWSAVERRHWAVKCRSSSLVSGSSLFTTAFKSSEISKPPNNDSADREIKEESKSEEKVELSDEGAEGAKPSGDEVSAEEAEAIGEDISREELIELVKQKNELFKATQKEIQEMQDKVLRSYAEAQNVMDRTRRDAENSKKFAIQSFAKSLLDVADNLERASSVAKESFSKLETSKDSNGAVALLKTLLEGVEMTEKQLADVFKKYGIEKYDPMSEEFDPNRHMAILQVPAPDKTPGTVALVLKCGYTLHDRVIRPAEVGVVEAVSETAEDVKPSA